LEFVDGGLGQEGVAEGAGEGIEALGAAGEEGEVPAVFFVDAADEGRGGSEDFDAVEVQGFDVFFGEAFQEDGVAFGEGGVFAFDGEVGHAAERGVSGGLAVAEFFGVEGGIVMMGGGLDGVVPGPEGLDVDFTGAVAASGASGDLGEELEGLFGGTEVGHVEAGVGIDDADEGHAGVVMAFGEHLGADEYVNFPAGKTLQDVSMTTFAGCCVAVHALDAGSGKGADKIVLCLLGARSKIKKGIEGALAADQRIGAACVAVMAEQISACTMIGKAYLTRIIGTAIAMEPISASPP